MKIESRHCGKDIEAWQMACKVTRKIFFETKKDYISQSSQSYRDAIIIKYFCSVFPVFSAREKYSTMHNIMDMKKNAKRLTVNCEL